MVNCYILIIRFGGEKSLSHSAGLAVKMFINRRIFLFPTPKGCAADPLEHLDLIYLLIKLTLVCHSNSPIHKGPCFSWLYLSWWYGSPLKLRNSCNGFICRGILKVHLQHNKKKVLHNIEWPKELKFFLGVLRTTFQCNGKTTFPLQCSIMNYVQYCR